MAASPANDAMASAAVVTGTNFRLTGTNTGATKEPSEPAHAGDPGGASVWWAWTAPASAPVRIATENSDFDTVLAVYAGNSLGTLEPVAANDDEDNGIVTSMVRFAAAKGVTYLIAVDGVLDIEPATGMIRLTLAMDLPPRIQSIQRTETGTIRLVCTGTPGRLCDIEASTDLRKWISIGRVLNAQGTIDFTDPDPTTTHAVRNYRLRQEP